MTEPDLNYSCPQCAAPAGVECDSGCPSTRLRVAEAAVAAVRELAQAWADRGSSYATCGRRILEILDDR